MLNRCDSNNLSLLSKNQVYQPVKTKNFFVKEQEYKSKPSSCCCCNKENHPLYHCDKFIQLNPNERYKLVREKKLCLNCLSNKHGIKNCNSQVNCNRCGKQHHTLLHFEPYSKPDPQGIHHHPVPVTPIKIKYFVPLQVIQAPKLFCYLPSR